MNILPSIDKSVVDYSQFTRKKMNLTYAEQSSSQKLDIVYPDQGSGPFPLIIFVHGGGFVGGSKDEFTIAFIFKLISQGYAVASVEYRLALEAPWPAQIYDVKAAVRWLRANGKELELSTEKVLMCGNSAGATLTQLTAATGGKELLEDLSMGNAEQSCKVDAIISWYGLGSFEMELSTSQGITHAEYARITNIQEECLDGYPELLDSASLLLRKPAREHMDEVKAMSPLNYVDRNFPYALFQHGTADTVLDYRQSIVMAGKICSHCGAERAEVDLFPGAVHGDPRIKADENMQRCLRFIKTYLPGGYPGEFPMPEIRLTRKQD